MALLYRAIWSDQRPDLVDSGPGTFRAWLDSKALRIAVPHEGVVGTGTEEVAVARVDDGGLHALRMRLVEERQAGSGEQRWSTTAHWMSDGANGWIWVDLEWVSDEPFAHQPEVAAPNLVAMLLEADGAQLNGVHLGPKPLRVARSEVQDLVSWIHDRDRRAPVVVFSTDVGIGPEAYSRRVREVARRLAGCVDVRMLTSDSEPGFDSAMRPSSMSVFGGAARVYLPGIDPSDPVPWRHRYVRTQMLTDRPRIAAGRIAHLVLPRMVAQRPPEIYRTRVKQLLDQTLGDEQTDWKAMALELDQVVTELQADNEELREEKDLAHMEALESERAAADALHKLEALRSRLRVIGEVPEALEQQVAEAPIVSSCADALNLAEQLENIMVHPDSPRDIDRMDQSPDAELWGQRLWTHLQSLDAYATEKGAGFKTWCENSGHPLAISPKFIAMTESETVCNNPRLRDRRLLPIDSRVNPSGKIEMLAHIKSVQGGGMQIPRIYFHDDTKGATGKVHVGFVGPHDLMPNTLTK